MPRKEVQFIEDPTNENGGSHKAAMFIGIGVLLLFFLSLYLSSCTNRQLHDKWEARGIRRGWLDTTHKPIGVIIPDSALLSHSSAVIDKITDSLIRAGFAGNIRGVKPIYINNDTCIDKKSVEYLVKWKVLPPVRDTILNNIYKSLTHEDENLLLFIEYDKNGKPQVHYKIKTPVHIVPKATPTAWQQIKAFFVSLGQWLMWLIIALVIIAGIAAWKFITK